jgi:hypothetical protein
MIPKSYIPAAWVGRACIPTTRPPAGMSYAEDGLSPVEQMALAKLAVEGSEPHQQKGPARAKSRIAGMLSRRQPQLLDVLAKNNLPEDIVALITPKSVQTADKHGCTPLHYAVMHRLEPSIVRSIVDMWPKSMQYKDKNGKVPLHYASAYSEDAALVALLLDKWPEAAQQVNNFGSLPLHNAAQRSTSVPLVSKLIQAWPEALLYKDTWGRTPLHLAALGSRSVAVCATLIAAAPETMNLKCNDGDRPTELSWRYPHVKDLFEWADTPGGLARIKEDATEAAAAVGERAALRTQLAVLGATSDPEQLERSNLEDVIARGRALSLDVGAVEAKLQELPVTAEEPKKKRGEARRKSDSFLKDPTKIDATPETPLEEPKNQRREARRKSDSFLKDPTKAGTTDEPLAPMAEDGKKDEDGSSWFSWLMPSPGR